MWIVYDEYEELPGARFHSVQDAGDFVEASEDPLTYRIRYED